MIIVVGGIKGGSGKTTLATNLVVMRSTEKKVLLVDADEQHSACDWAAQREGAGIHTAWSTIQLAGKSIYAQVQRMAPDYDDIIIDVGGRDTTSQRSALTIANVFLIPFKPRSLDIWTIGAAKAMISEIKVVNPSLKCLALINQADSRGSDNEEAIEVLQECCDITCPPCSIGHRKSFCNAASEGLGVTELRNADKKAVQEMADLYKYIFNTTYA